MAEIKPVETDNNRFQGQVEWADVDSGDTFQEAGIGQYPSQTLQISGTLSGATVGLEGSNDGTNWVDLTTDGSTAIDGLGIFWVWETPRYVRPSLSGGDGSTDLTFTIVFSKLI